MTGPEALVAVPGDRWFVLGGVLLSRTLAGAVPSALSGLASGFGMGTGRFPVAVTTETTVRAVLRCLVRLFGYPCDCLPPHMRVWLVVWVGCGPYSGRSRLPLSLTPPVLPRTLSVCVVCGWGCCCLCWPISTSQLTDRYRSSTSGLSTQ